MRISDWSSDVCSSDLDGDSPHSEWSPRKPSNPYSASKSAQEDIAYSYWRAFGIPLVVTNTMNLIGPRQHPEKFVPKMIRALKNGEPLTIHAQQKEDGTWESGTRCWLGVTEVANEWPCLDWTSVVYGMWVSVRVGLGG